MIAMRAAIVVALAGVCAAGVPEYIRLDCGLRVVLIEDHALPLVSVQLAYDVGSAQDPPGTPGLCHIARVWATYGDELVAKTVDGGLDFRVETGRDVCTFQTVLPPEYLDDVLATEALRLQRRPVTDDALPALRATAAAVQSPVAAEDIDWPRAIAAAFGDGPYAHDPALLTGDPNALDADKINGFSERWFTPTNATLVIVGAFQPPTVKEQVRRLFTDVQWADKTRATPPAMPPTEQLRYTTPARTRAGVDFVFRTAGLGNLDLASLDTLLPTLTERLAAAVDAAARREKRAAVPNGVHWRRTAWRGAGVLVLSVDIATCGADAETLPTEVEQRLRTAVSEAVAATLQSLADAPPTPVELNQARAQALCAWRVVNARFATRAARLGEYETVAGDALKTELYAETLAGATANHVQTAVAGLRKQTPITIVRTTHADTNDPALPPLPAAAPTAALVPIDNVTALLNRDTTGTPTPIQPANAPTLQTATLADWLHVHVLPVNGLPATVVATRVQTDPNMLPEAPATFGPLPTAPANWPPESSAQRDAYLAYHGLELGGITSPGHAGLVGSGPPAALNALLEWQCRYLHPRFRGGACEPTDIFIVGTPDVAATCEFVRLLWLTDANAAAPAAAAPPDAASTPSPNAAGPTLAIRWERAATPEVVFEIHCNDSASTDVEPLVLDAYAYVLGCPPAGVAIPYLGHAYRWTRWCWTGTGWEASARLGDASAVELIRPSWAHLRQLAAGTAPETIYAAGLRYARVRRLVELDSATALLAAVWAGRTDPWDSCPDVTTSDLQRRLPLILRQATATYTVRSPDADDADGVRSLLSR